MQSPGSRITMSKLESKLIDVHEREKLNIGSEYGLRRSIGNNATENTLEVCKFLMDILHI